MFRAAARSTPRALRHPYVASASRPRFASTAPADKRYTWKGSAARWGLAIGALYWYNTSPLFAEELPSRLSPEPPHFSESDLPTVDAIVEEKRKQLDARLKAKEEQAAKGAQSSQTSTPPPPPPKDGSKAVAAPGDAEKSPEQLEEEAGQQGAFNPETGEINWDCPCLGGMAHGPCGEEFKAAFSCFVYSNEEPKGMDCIDKFQHMQDCFRKYPDVYGEEIADEDAADAEVEAAAAGSPAPAANARDATTREPAPAAEAKSEKTAPAPASEKPAKTTEYTTEEHKGGPTDAPKGAHPVNPSAANAAVNGESKKSRKDELETDPRGLPKRSFDATAANPKESK